MDPHHSRSDSNRNGVAPRSWVYGAVATGTLILVLAQSRSATFAQSSQGLRTPITLAEPDIMLDRLLTRLQGLSGVAQVAADDAGFEHVAVFCTNQPLGELHKSIRDLLGWTITPRETDGRTAYHFAPSSRLEREQQAERERVRRAYRRQLDTALQLSALNPDSPEWAQFKQDRPTEAISLANPVVRPLHGMLRRLQGPRLDAVLAGRAAVLDFPTLPADFRQLLDEAYTAMEWPREGPIRTVTVQLELGKTGLPEHIDFAYQFANGKGKVHLYAAHAGVLSFFDNPGKAEAEQRATARKAELDQHPILGQQVPAFREPLDPTKLAAEMNIYTIALLDLHRRTKLPVLAAVYPHAVATVLGGGSIARRLTQMEGRRLWEVLDDLSGSPRWRLANGTILLRSSYWFGWRPLEKQLHARMGLQPKEMTAAAAPCCDE